MADNTQINSQIGKEQVADQLDPLDRGEASVSEKTAMLEVSLLDLENTGNGVHRRSEEFHQTQMEDENAVFRTRKDHERRTSYEFVKRAPIGEKEKARRERLKSKTLILLEQAAADICASKRRFPEIFGKIMKAFENSDNLNQKEQLQTVKKDLMKLKVDLRKTAQMYFLESVLLLRQFKQLFPEEFQPSENNPGTIELIMREFYLRVGRDTSNQAKLEYFPEVLSASIEQIMTDERIDNTEEDITEYLSLMEKHDGTQDHDQEREKTKIEKRLQSRHEELKQEMAIDQKAKQDFDENGSADEETVTQAA